MILTQVPVPEDKLVNQVAGGLIFGGESELLKGGVLLQGLHKLPLGLSGNRGPLVGHPQFLQGAVNIQDISEGFQTGTSDPNNKKKNYRSKNKQRNNSKERELGGRTCCSQC